MLTALPCTLLSTLAVLMRFLSAVRTSSNELSFLISPPSDFLTVPTFSTLCILFTGCVLWINNTVSALISSLNIKTISTFVTYYISALHTKDLINIHIFFNNKCNSVIIIGRCNYISTFFYFWICVIHCNSKPRIFYHW